MQFTRMLVNLWLSVIVATSGRWQPRNDDNGFQWHSGNCFLKSTAGYTRCHGEILIFFFIIVTVAYNGLYDRLNGRQWVLGSGRTASRKEPISVSGCESIWPLTFITDSMPLEGQYFPLLGNSQVHSTRQSFHACFRNSDIYLTSKVNLGRIMCKPQ